jgi:LmbE family N-acetylglucosaminyl deacetylase
MDLPGQPSLTAANPTRDLPIPKRALAIGAHPDDVEFGAGATLAKWAAAGCEVHHLICTDGSKGTWDVTADLPTLVARRADEQREAARRLGATGTVTMLDAVDGELDSSLQRRGQVAFHIRRVRPDVVVGHDPWRRYRLHPDHRHAGYLAVEGIVAARDPHFFPEHGIAAHRPQHLLLWEADVVDHFEDVDGFVDAKLAALEAHESQFESTMHASSDGELAKFRDRVRRRLSEVGDAAGCGAAEAFKRIDDL